MTNQNNNTGVINAYRDNCPISTFSGEQIGHLVNFAYQDKNQLSSAQQMQFGANEHAYENNFFCLFPSSGKVVDPPEENTLTINSPNGEPITDCSLIDFSSWSFDLTCIGLTATETFSHLAAIQAIIQGIDGWEFNANTCSFTSTTADYSCIVNTSVITEPCENFGVETEYSEDRCSVTLTLTGTENATQPFEWTGEAINEYGVFNEDKTKVTINRCDIPDGIGSGFSGDIIDANGFLGCFTSYSVELATTEECNCGANRCDCNIEIVNQDGVSVSDSTNPEIPEEYCNNPLRIQCKDNTDLLVTGGDINGDTFTGNILPEGLTGSATITVNLEGCEETAILKVSFPECTIKSNTLTINSPNGKPITDCSQIDFENWDIDLSCIGNTIIPAGTFGNLSEMTELITGVDGWTYNDENCSFTSTTSGYDCVVNTTESSAQCCADEFIWNNITFAVGGEDIAGNVEFSTNILGGFNGALINSSSITVTDLIPGTVIINSTNISEIWTGTPNSIYYVEANVTDVNGLTHWEKHYIYHDGSDIKGHTSEIEISNEECTFNAISSAGDPITSVNDNPTGGETTGFPYKAGVNTAYYSRAKTVNIGGTDYELNNEFYTEFSVTCK